MTAKTQAKTHCKAGIFHAGLPQFSATRESHIRSRGFTVTASSILQGVFGAIFIGVVSAVFAISFAAIIYTGELAPYFDRGVGLTLLGAAVIGLIGSLCLSYPGTIAQSQDVPAILLAGAAGTLVAGQQLSGEVLFATVACLIATASLATGLVAMGVGRYRLAMLVRYLPYPVIAGFLAATGLLLFLGALEVATGIKPSLANLSIYLQGDVLLKCAPVCLAGAAIVLASKLFQSRLTLPICLVLTACAFYAIIFWLGMDQASAQAAGYLLGPFNSGGFLVGVGPQILTQAEWGTILSQVPVVLTIVVIATIGTTLNATGLELALRRDLDINQEVKGVGYANTLAAFVGGLPGYHFVGQTILAGRLGHAGRVAGISTSVACLLVFFVGGTVLSFLPIGLFASVIAYLGLDLLYTWLWAERPNLKQRDYLIVFLIPIIAVTVSFLTAIAVGLGVAAIFFVYTYAKLDIIRAKSSVAARRSFVERPSYERDILIKTGDQAPILELSGYLFFASSNALRTHVQKLLEADKPSVRWLILDLEQVSGIDVSAWYMLQRLVADCERQEVSLLITGLERLTASEPQKLSAQLTAPRFDNIRQAIEHVEEALLRDNGDTVGEHILSAEIHKTLSLKGLQDYLTHLTVTTGDVVIEQGAASDDIYFLTAGELLVSITQPGGTARVVAKIKAGSLIGEFAYYNGQIRSANIIAQGEAQLVRLDMQRLAGADAQDLSAVVELHKLIARYMARRLTQTTAILRELGY